ncbi:uncharacterized protein MYCGRDRAFT_35259, partial [Zymoseptoria tritici IPO323]
RSCAACAKAKVRCSGQKPACSRCVSRSHDCHYATAKMNPTMERRIGLESSASTEMTREDT